MSIEFDKSPSVIGGRQEHFGDNIGMINYQITKHDIYVRTKLSVNESSPFNSPRDQLRSEHSTNSWTGILGIGRNPGVSTKPGVSYSED